MRQADLSSGSAIVRTSVTNCISIDVEGFVEANLQSFRIDESCIDKRRETYEIEKNMDAVFELLARLDMRGTFFFLGRIAQDVPRIVRTAGEAGHEIACHSYKHVRIFGTSRSEFAKDLSSAKGLLEDVSGQRVYGFRAPDFSITEKSIWALDVLRELGFSYDSSIYPIGMHDVYGIEHVKPTIHRLPNGLIEFPLSTIGLFGTQLPFGGGGSFRLYPLPLTKFLIRRVNARGQPCMVYIHPYEVGPILPNVPRLSHFRRFRHYFDCKNGYRRLKSLLGDF